MRESEMKSKGNLILSIEDKIQMFWEWYNQNKDKLIEIRKIEKEMAK